MSLAVVFDSAGTLLYTLRVAKDIPKDRIVEGVETTTLTCSEKGRSLVLLYVNSKELIEAEPEMLLSEYLTQKEVSFGVACSSIVTTTEEISELLYRDKKATCEDLQTCIRKVWSCCKKMPVVALNNGVIVNKNINSIEFAITSGGRPFPNAKDTIRLLHENNIASYVASGDRTDKLIKMADYLGIPHGNVYGVSTPKIKAQIVSDLKEQYDKVIMVGDGINDLTAMKKADIAILTEEQYDKKPKVLEDVADYIIKDVSEVFEIAKKYNS
ncbi:HAD family hydrolase [Methanolacinia paynteri]|uniref:HAD family hydrolase n=1 Tax=Methanolacinia paynteri TaxID=230356 RepID=UPI00065001E1|nr:HAD family hydrolase [Methanolacinia paynteri]